jgi:hypothetical protein
MPTASRCPFAIRAALLVGAAVLTAGVCRASQQQPVPEPSLGDLARKQRAQATSPLKSPKVYTNDNLPSAAGNLTILGTPEMKGGAEAAAGKPAVSTAKHGEEYYCTREHELRQRLDVHQRELEVLQQRLGQNQVQYYSNPSEALQQQHSREDINRLQEAIDQKQQQVDADRQALTDLEDELRSQGGDPGWLHAEASASHPAARPDLSGVQKGSEEYWRLRFKAAREALAHAQEARQLAEDELGLLQSQQAHDWGTSAATSADSRIAEKSNEVASTREAETEAQQELDALDNEFQQSGAPEEWSKPDNATPDSSVSLQEPDA